MRNIKQYILGAVALLTVCGCNLDKFPESAINTENAMESADDCLAFRNGLYSGMKYCFTGAFVYAPELQTDMYHAVKNFGNFYGNFYHYNVTAGESLASTIWFSLYSYIGNANFLIDGTKKLMNSGTLSQEDLEDVKTYYGEACYIRAHMYYLLTTYFCEDFEPDTAGNVYGVPVATVYAPTGDASKYPERGSLAATFAQISADLSEAEKHISTVGVQNSAYVTADVVTAMQARVALAMHDYDTAFLKAKQLIDGGKYPLVSDAKTYAQAWINDNLQETIWQIAMLDQTDIGNSYNYFIYNTSGVSGKDNPQYIPEDWVLDLYDRAKDIRYNSYFEERDIITPVVGKLTLLIKYPGNPKLYSAVTNYVNMPKVFRISEMYLIAAEAAANRQGQDFVASQYLNELKSKRISGWKDKDYSGVELMREIRNERVRELFGEGFRMNDLKRWHIGFSRSAGQDPSLVMPGSSYAECTREADDPYFLWPIPTAEIEANPKIKQNPAYTN